MIDNKKFRQGLAVMFATFPSIKPTTDAEFTLRIWQRAFKDLSSEEFISGVEKFVTTVDKLYPTDNWIAMLLKLCRPKVSETVGDIIEQILNVLGSVSFVYFDEDSRKKLNELKAKCPIAYAVGQRLGWSEMARTDNIAVLRGQIKTVAEEEIRRANESGTVVISSVGRETIDLPRRLAEEVKKIETRQSL